MKKCLKPSVASHSPPGLKSMTEIRSSFSTGLATVTGGPYSVVASGMVLSYEDTDVTNGVTYYYTVSASNSVLA